MTIPPALPEIFSALRDYQWTPVTSGRSPAQVWRITFANGSSAFLKAEALNPLNELPGEIERLNWLTRMGFKAPRIVDAAEADGRLYALLTAVPGQDLSHYTGNPAQFCRILAQGLRRLHALDPAHCPFDHSLDNRLEQAEARLAAGLVDESDFDAVRRGWTGRQVLDWLAANRPGEGERIVTHGDVSTQNVMADDGRFSGMVDCGRLGLADIWQDLALACRGVVHVCGEDYVPALLASYGAEWDEAKYNFYCALDELF